MVSYSDHDLMDFSSYDQKKVGILHGAGYVGGELVRIVLNHPNLELAGVTSRTFAGDPLSSAHAHLRGQSDHSFVKSMPTLNDLDALLVAAEHGRSCQIIPDILAGGFEGAIVDLSADFRHTDPKVYSQWYDLEHPAPNLLDDFQYGLPDVYAPYDNGTRLVANPGCFATAISLALYPISRQLPNMQANVTALTGASGSGARPSSGTHFPTRDGNVRAYKVLGHQHHPEIQTVCGDAANVAFTPVSGPFTRGIWGTANIKLQDDVSSADVSAWFDNIYANSPLIRLWPDEIPELRYAVNTPFCDIGWMVQRDQLVVGFAIDNLLKGAASQAVHNLNLLLKFPETAGLLPVGASANQHASVPA